MSIAMFDGYDVVTPPAGTGIGPSSSVEGENYWVGVRYRTSLMDAHGAETPMSDPSGIVAFVNMGGRSPNAVRIPLPVGGDGCVARVVYRTQNVYDTLGSIVEGRLTRFYRLTVVRDNVSTSFVDAHSDYELGPLVAE